MSLGWKLPGPSLVIRDAHDPVAMGTAAVTLPDKLVPT